MVDGGNLKLNTMKVHYVRVSTLFGQNTDRQKVNVDYDLLLEDRCSGSIPFFERPSGLKVKDLVDKGSITSLSVHHPDRICRNTIDFLQTIKYFKDKKVNIHFVSQGLNILDEDGKENPVSKMVLSLMGIFSELEKSLIRERVMEGILVARAKGKYMGRKKGTTEDTFKFLSKPKNKRVIEYIRKGYKPGEIKKITGASPNTIIKVKKLIHHDNNY